MPPPRSTKNPDRVDLVQIGHRVVAFGDVAQFRNGSNVAVHGVNGLKRNELWPVRVYLLETKIKILWVIVLEDPVVCPRMSYSLDHRGMVARIGKDNAVRDLPASVPRAAQLETYPEVKSRAFSLP